MFITRYLILALLLYGCWACSSGTSPKAQRVLTDSTFYVVLKQVPEMKLPVLIDQQFLYDESERPKSVLPDSNFIKKFISCNNIWYPNMDFKDHKGYGYELRGKKQLNDSVYILLVQIVGTSCEPKYRKQLNNYLDFLVYNVYQSTKPVETIKIGDYSLLCKGPRQTTTYIDSSWNLINTNFAVDLLHVVGNIFPIRVLCCKGQLKANGRFQRSTTVAASINSSLTPSHELKIVDSSKVEIMSYLRHYKARNPNRILLEETVKNKLPIARLTREGDLIVTDFGTEEDFTEKSSF